MKEYNDMEHIRREKMDKVLETVRRRINQADEVMAHLNIEVRESMWTRTREQQQEVIDTAVSGLIDYENIRGLYAQHQVSVRPDTSVHDRRTNEQTTRQRVET